MSQNFSYHGIAIWGVALNQRSFVEISSFGLDSGCKSCPYESMTMTSITRRRPHMILIYHSHIGLLFKTVSKGHEEA